MVFIEALIFTKKVDDYMNDTEYQEFQSYLASYPSRGDIIPGTGGLRKIRWSSFSKGKRGGIRIIYYWQNTEDQIYLLTLYAKNEMIDLSVTEKKMLSKMIERW